MTPTEERVQQSEQKANHTINELNRALRNAVVWGGMNWHYNPLHPMYVRKCLDLIKAHHADKLKPAVGVFSKPALDDVDNVITYAFEVVDAVEATVVDLQTRLNNIACIVAKARSSWGTVDKFAETDGPIDSLDEIEDVLRAKESK